MDWAQFKDPVFHMCLAGAVVASRSVTQKLAGFNHFIVTTLVTEFSEFNENMTLYNRHKEL